uniref:Poly [ADP-ribose] polymerase n=1 Tax=Periophthalmus magnuspinnatus TaxID=409849 RepID=A0A3B4A468_9GOBI
MDTSDIPWSWYYLADCGQWHRFEVKFTVSIFSKMKVKLMNLFYSCSCFSAAPVFWEMIDASCPYQLIPLKTFTAEYLTVANYVKRDGLLDKHIVSIFRIQNQDLWEFFCRKKKQLMRIHSVKEIEERRLFHGTKKSNVDSICKYNFDISLAGHHGHLFGKGIYFAKHATYADKYSPSSTEALPLYGKKTASVQDQPTKVIFLARVLVGKSSQGQKLLTKPDQDAQKRSHDSCVDDTNSPRIYVIFDSNQIYPEYLIQYR